MRNGIPVLPVIAAAAALACQVEAASDPPSPPQGAPLFEELSPDSSGLKFVQRLDPDDWHAYLYHSGYACGGVCTGDIDGDGQPDVFLVSGPDENALFLNRGGLRFERREDAVTGDGSSWGAGAAMADIEGDGDLDIYVCNYDSPNRLFLNDGRGRFSECALASGLAFFGPSLCPYFADFDRDGDLDLFLLTNRLYSPNGYPAERAWFRDKEGKAHVKENWAPYLRIVTPPFPVASKDPFLQEYGHADRVFRNDGAGVDGLPKFKDVTAGSGLESDFGHGLSAVIWDINRDGLPDIYVANDFIDPDRLWLNLGPGKDGGFRFRDATDEFLPYTSWFSMGSDVCDLNNDGRLDFFVADMAATTHFKAKTTMGEMTGMRRWVMENGWPRQLMHNCLFIDSGAGRFLEGAFLAGVARSDWTWSVRLADFDLDGRADIFLTNGIARAFSDSDVVVTEAMRIGRTEWDLYKNLPEMREINLAFRGGKSLHFEPAGVAWGLAKEGMSYAAASADFDRDGDLDLVVCNLTENISLYRNRAADRGARWLEIRLEGAGRNRAGIGAVVTAHMPDGTKQTRLMQPQTGFLAGNDPIIHFGLGDHVRIDRLEVLWPDGTVLSTGPQQSGQILTVRQSDTGKTADHPPPPPPPIFREVAKERGLEFKHSEVPYDDYRREFLLPGKLSQFGPGIAVADVNADGRDDIFAGGAAGQSAVLFIQGADHRFAPLRDPPWARQAASEDMGALFFDADRDGDLDLYVVSGSNEWPAGDPNYADHLYINKQSAAGMVAFGEASPGALPDLRQSGSCVAGADFDRDGDVDLFIGSRSIPGAYLSVPDSVFLRNDGSAPNEVKFTDIAGTVAGLQRAGLVTAAIWSDVDSDTWPDLLVACEWGPVRLFLNQRGRLTEMTEAAELAARTGWWNALTAADIDGDGDIDYAALNTGLNTKYGQPTAAKPVVLYRGDMDQRGGADLIEAKCATDGELPVRGRSCSGTAMPFIKEKFGTYRAFASASLADIYSTDALSRAQRFTATCLESGWLINESSPGRPRFTWRPLPPEVQISPGFGCAVADFTGDSRPSLAVAQNLFTREPETGLWRGGLGAIVRGTPGDFAPLNHGATGFVVAGDARALALADLDGDFRPDLVVSQNNDRLLAFQHSAVTDAKPSLVFNLAGPPGNPSALGARLSIGQNGKPLLTTEIHGGSGYLSQSTPRVFLTPRDASPVTVSVMWPDGSSSRHTIDAAPGAVTLRPDQP